MFSKKLFDFKTFLYVTMLLITTCNTWDLSCTVSIWDTGEMKADDHPSIFLVVQEGPDENPFYHLPQFKIKNRTLQVEFKSEEKLISICGRSNMINADETTIVCSNGKTVPDDVEIIKKCKTSEAKPELHNMGIPCGGSKSIKDSLLYLIGYNVFPRYSIERPKYGDNTRKMTSVFFSFIQVCLDLKRKTTLYTSHNVDGRVIAARQILSFIPDKFSMEGYVEIDGKFKTGIDKIKSLHTTYIPQKQFHYLYTWFKGALRDYFDNEDNNFVPRQLTPDYDMLLKNYKTLTHYYINTAPQWKIISCTWDALEELIRERASDQSAEVSIFTGTYDTLALNGIEVFLSAEKLSVPKYFWKIVLHKRIDRYAAIGFITSNNPYDTEKEPFCESVCRQKEWPIDVKTPGLGKTVCCTVKEMLLKMGIKIPILNIDGTGFIYLSKVKEVLVLSSQND